MIHIESSKFISNVAQKRGGAISAESFNNITIVNNTEFSENEALKEFSDSIFAINSK